LYEAVRSDRNLYSKNLIEAQDEVSELKRKFGIASLQINQLKDEIESKDTALTSSQHELGVARKESDKNKDEMNAEKTKNESLNAIVQNLKSELTRNTLIIRELNNDYEIKKKEIAKVINQRDVLGTQLIRRNDELALLYEKIKILQTNMSKGETEYH
jgi:chromosome segregation ATPase